MSRTSRGSSMEAMVVADGVTLRVTLPVCRKSVTWRDPSCSRRMILLMRTPPYTSNGHERRGSLAKQLVSRSLDLSGAGECRKAAGTQVELAILLGDPTIAATQGRSEEPRVPLLPHEPHDHLACANSPQLRFPSYRTSQRLLPSLASMARHLGRQQVQVASRR